MTPEQEKALELSNKFYQGSPFDYGKKGHLIELKNAKNRAKLCVKEIINNIEATILYHKDSVALPINLKFWLSVLYEIDNLGK